MTHGAAKVGAQPRIPLSLVDVEFDRNEEDLRRDERELRLAAEELAGALDRVRQALMALRGGSLEPRARQLFGDLEELQGEATAELGRRVGERVAAECRWRVRAGIEVLDPQT